MMMAAGALAVLVLMLLALFRALAGPSQWDRILGLNTFGTATVLLIALMGFIGGRPDFVDIALLYALINFIGTFAVLKFIRFGDLGHARDHEDEWS